MWLVSVGMGKGLGLSGFLISPDMCFWIREGREWARTVGNRNEEKRKVLLP